MKLQCNKILKWILVASAAFIVIWIVYFYYPKNKSPFSDSNYEGFIHDQPMWSGDCNCVHRRRIDHRMLIGNTLLCVETDEFQHKRYDNKDEEIRYDDLYMIHGGKFIFIRFNPDKYIDKKGKTIETTVKKRLDRLKEEVDNQINRINNEEKKLINEIIK